MSAAGWGALATVVLALGVVSAGFWALYNHRQAQRLKAAQWTQTVLHDFYEERFYEIKCALQYEYAKRLRPLLEDRNREDRDRHIWTPEEVALLEQLDMLLNYFEYMLYLEEEGHFEGRDGHAVFSHWFGILETEEMAALRHYIDNGRFRRIHRELSYDKEGCVAVG